jgi:hypothetical protein
MHELQEEPIANPPILVDVCLSDLDHILDDGGGTSDIYVKVIEYLEPILF